MARCFLPNFRPKARSHGQNSGRVVAPIQRLSRLTALGMSRSLEAGVGATWAEAAWLPVDCLLPNTPAREVINGQRSSTRAHMETRVTALRPIPTLAT